MTASREQAVAYGVTFIGGQNEALHPRLLRDDQYRRGVDVANRNGLPRTRPRFRKVANLPNGTFRGAFFYSHHALEENINYVVCSIGTKIYLVNLKDPSNPVEFNHGLKTSEADRHYMAQVENYLVIQDGVYNDDWSLMSWPKIIDGLSLNPDNNQTTPRSSSPRDAFPKGSVMHYTHGRCFVKVGHTFVPSDSGTGTWIPGRGVTFRAGDIRKPYRPYDALNFTEDVLLDGGGTLQVDTLIGRITGMTSQKNVQSGTGHGPLVVLCERGAQAYAVDLPRSASLVAAGDSTDIQTWSNSQFGRIIFMQGGTLSPDSLVHVNNDVLYRSQDGLRSIRYTAAMSSAENLSLSTHAMGGEVQPFFDEDDQDWHPFMSSAYANKRFVTTFASNGTPYSFRALAAMDASLASMGTQSFPPIWDGCWTGLTFNQVLSIRYQGRDYIAVIAEESIGSRGLYILDDYGEVQALPIAGEPSRSRIYLKDLDFGSPFILKHLSYVEIWIHEIETSGTMKAYYKTDGHPFWTPTYQASWSSPSQPGRIRKLRLEVGSNLDQIALRDIGGLNSGCLFSIMLEWTGRCRVMGYKVAVHAEDSDDFVEATSDEFNPDPTDTISSIPQPEADY